MRGLKHQDQKYDDAQRMSHLLQMRGLKPIQTKMKAYLSLSHLLQMRGLKPPTVPNINIGNVASFTDAWIETLTPKSLFYANWRRIFYRCVD